ncbi:MAG: D-alanyl-D-alanine carboxypeptidase/D-alanyl-D-alanine-endopeptidase [Bdellovibrionales bacterium]|nr:D-alanyl-D-alanine carboxypeptidase/D-alanyl-D-alanine-endopeptidase [Bdellovibrionales bacterium]
MRQILPIILLLFAVPGKSATFKQQADEVVSKVIAESGIDKKHFGIWVMQKDEASILNGDQLFVPASLSKMPTALAFLNHFKMDQYFNTWVYKTGKIEDGVLKGDLYLKGGGDPSFVNESMWMMINKLKRSDIKKIEGQLYVDESYFDNDYYSEGRQKRRVDRAYDAPVGALSFNWNTISIYVRPGLRAGQAARVYLDPPVPFVKVVNSAKTGSDLKSSLKVERTSKNGEMQIRVTGTISQKEEEKAFYKSIENPALWTGMNFKYFLNEFGIEYKGDIKKAVAPKEADVLVEYKSWDMGRIVKAMSKFSNNFVAEMLTKHLGKKEGIPASIDDGLDEINKFLAQKGWKAKEFSFVNPSGFTHNNKIRASQLGELLYHSLEDFNFSPEFLAALPISGTDGTLKKRMTQVMKGRVRAKTGYLTGVVSLGGYLQSRTGNRPITFVFFYNGPYKHDWEVRALFDKILWRLYQKS